MMQNTLTSTKTGCGGEKPKLPAKPAHIRPGLKPVQIPNVDDKLGKSYCLCYELFSDAEKLYDGPLTLVRLPSH